MDTTAQPLAEPAPVRSPWSPLLPRLRGLVSVPAATLRDAAQRGDWIPPALLLLLGLAIYTMPVAYRMGMHQTGLMEEIANQAKTPRPRTGDESAAFFRIFGAGFGAFAAGAAIPNVLYLAAGSWFARAGVLYFIGRVLMKSPGRSFLSLFTTVGWAWFPLFLQYVLLGMVFASYSPAMSFFVPLPSTREAMQTGGMMQLMNASWRNWVLFFATPLVWWNWYLCTLAVEASLQLPRARAALTVALQALLHVVYAVAAYFATSAWLRLMESFSTTPGSG